MEALRKPKRARKNKGFWGLGVWGWAPQSGPLFSYDRELRISLCGVGGMGEADKSAAPRQR